MSENILEVKNLHVSFKTYAGISHAVRGVDFSLRKGETLPDAERLSRPKRLWGFCLLRIP